MERTSLKKVESLICTQSSPGGIEFEEEESDPSKEGVFSLCKLSKPEKPYSSFKSSNDNNENYAHTHIGYQKTPTSTCFSGSFLFCLPLTTS